MMDRWFAHSPRLLILLGLACLAALGSALVAQHVYHVNPCVWCVLQRGVFLLIAAVCLLGGLLGLLFKQRAQAFVVRIASLPLVLLSVSGLVAATYQHEVANELSSCKMSTAEKILNYLDLETLWPDVFMATAQCADAAKYRLLGLPYEIWSGLMFALCLAIGLVLLLRTTSK